MMILSRLCPTLGDRKRNSTFGSARAKNVIYIESLNK